MRWSALQSHHALQGYDAVALSGGGRSVVGLDVCDAVVQRARQRSSASPDVAFTHADFFTWVPPKCFHLIFDYTYTLHTPLLLLMKNYTITFSDTTNDLLVNSCLFN